ncbi:MAG TPA: nicotinate (nicotinamide) nucleotide adenylyltransferase [Candidatus Dormibacteraeota bacterium]|nr:nicotinate (nicotinamide) nucleotide adenylyltransferase [Candidatus Dormibacteraeota bacterium]
MTAPSAVVLLFGGTFDPVHLGHLAAADQLRARTGAGAAWLVPSAQPPHRRAPEAPPQDRLRMVELAVADRPGLIACPLEVERGGRSYTVDTLAAVRAAHPTARLLLALGADAARALGRWRQPERLLALAELVVYDRPGVAPMGAGPGPDLPPGEWAWHHVGAIDAPALAATAIRRRLRAGDACADALPPAVAAYIRARGLYRPEAGAAHPAGAGIIGLG